MKILTIRQPWAWFIIRPDITDPAERARLFAAGQIKPVENRDWPTKVRGPFLVHAAKGMTRDEWEGGIETARRCGVPLADLRAGAQFDQLQRGGIIGSVELVDCVTDHPSRWFCGKFGFVLAKPQPLPFQPLVGRLGFFEAPGVATSS